MAVQDILLLGNPLLHRKCEAVSYPLSESTKGIIRDLDDTLDDFRRKHGFGRGIATPQIGLLQRIIFINDDNNRFSGPLINPRIIRLSSEKQRIWDDCFSFPDLLVNVERAMEVSVEYENEEGTVGMLDATADFAELLQHEIDHLDGILSTQRAITPTSFALREEWEKLSK